MGGSSPSRNASNAPSGPPASATVHLASLLQPASTCCLRPCSAVFFSARSSQLQTCLPILCTSPSTTSCRTSHGLVVCDTTEASLCCQRIRVLWLCSAATIFGKAHHAPRFTICTHQYHGHGYHHGRSDAVFCGFGINSSCLALVGAGSVPGSARRSLPPPPHPLQR